MTVTLEIDHVFVMTDPGAPVADELVEAGISEGTSRSHPGQGTSNRRFFFENVMFEFLWIRDPVEASSELVQPTRLLERWRLRDTGGSPFGICFRPATQSDESPPFTTREYRPPYLPDDRSIEIADNAGAIEEPFLFFLPWVLPRENVPDHDAGLGALTEVTVRAPMRRPPTDALRTVGRLVHFEEAATHHLTLVFDKNGHGKTLDLRPRCPVTIRY